MELLKQQIEALIFCSEQSISLSEISASLKLAFEWELTDEELLAAIEEIKLRYQPDEFAFELVEVSEGFQFMTKKTFYPTISGLIQHKAKKRLSVAQMETLAIIAYRQPISKAEVEHIRGVSCDYAIQKLLEKELIEISGKSDGPGRPVLYSTSRTFMDYFGIKSVKDLPQLKDIHMEQNEIGMNAEMSDEVEQPSTTTEESPSSNEPEIEGSVEVTVTEEIETVLSEIESTEKMADFEVEEQPGEVSSEVPEIELPDRKTIFIQNELESNEEVEKPDEEI